MALTAPPNFKILLAFDFSLRRLGVATGNLLTKTAAPLTTLSVGPELPWDRLNVLIEEWNPGQLIVGIPDPGHSGAIFKKAGLFANNLEKRYSLPVARVDESLTSRAAESILRENRELGIMRKRVRKEHIDSRAACLIAEQWISTMLSERAVD